MGEIRFSGLGGRALRGVLAAVALTLVVLLGQDGALAQSASEDRARVAAERARARVEAMTPQQFVRECYFPLERSRSRTPLPAPDSLALTDRLLARMADECGAAAPSAGLENAYFRAAQANRMIGEGQPPRFEDPSRDGFRVADPGRLERARNQLNVVLGVAGVERQLRDFAVLEQVRVYRLLGRGGNVAAYQEAARLLERAGAASERAIRYEQAMIVIEQDRPGQQDDELMQTTAYRGLEEFADGEPVGYNSARNLYVVRRGPEALAWLAERLGREALARQRGSGDRQLALNYLDTAVRAYRQLGGGGAGAPSAIHVSMGLLNLEMASLQTDAGNGFECAPTPNTLALIEAQRNFRDALRGDSNNADAHWGLGCALVGGQNFPDAVEPLLAAVRLFEAGVVGPARAAGPPGPSDYYLVLAQALVGKGDFSGAQRPFREAIRRAPDDARKASMLMAFASVYLPLDPANAFAALNEAIALRRNDPAARLMRAEILMAAHDAGRQLSREDIVTLRGDFDVATGQWSRRARAFFLWSRFAESQGERRPAVTHAQQAYELERANPIYRRHACVTWVRFGRENPVGASPCETSDGSASAEESFFEGLFWMRVAYNTRGRPNDRRSNFGKAQGAFQHGIDDLRGDTGGAIEGAPGITLNDLLHYGRRYAIHCGGMGSANQSRLNEPGLDVPRGVFVRSFGLDQCWGA